MRHSELAADADLHHSANLDAVVEPDEGDLLLRITGIVPAAEFHPFVVRVARRLGLRGWIRHDPSGAFVRAVGEEIPLAQLVRAIWDESPRSARVRSLDPDLITGDTPPVGEHFIALVDEPAEWHDPEPTAPCPLQHVA